MTSGWEKQIVLTCEVNFCEWQDTTKKQICVLMTQYYNKLIDISENPLCLPGLQSVRSEQTERRILEIVRAGLQLSFRMSRQIIPWKKCKKIGSL